MAQCVNVARKPQWRLAGVSENGVANGQLAANGVINVNGVISANIL